LEPKNHPRFAHPAEKEFAKILNFYKIDWQYEPRTFALEWDEAGNVTTAFAPDFYLPDQDLYIELTTLRPSLSTKKNYKQRRMAELYPEVNLILLKRRDIRNLMLKFGLDQQAQGIIGTGAQKGSQNEG
jgi:hypoxanthine phosphoribosyltransferase